MSHHRRRSSARSSQRSVGTFGDRSSLRNIGYHEHLIQSAIALLQEDGDLEEEVEENVPQQSTAGEERRGKGEGVLEHRATAVAGNNESNFGMEMPNYFHMNEGGKVSKVVNEDQDREKQADDMKDTDIDGDTGDGSWGEEEEPRHELKLANMDLANRGCIFRTFARIVILCQLKWLKRATLLLIYFDFFMKMFIFSIYVAEENPTSLDWMQESARIVMFVVMLSIGIRPVLVSIFGLPILFHSGILVWMVLDLVVWIAGLVVDFFLFRGIDGFLSNPSMTAVAIGGLLAGIRLNTVMFFDKALASVVIESQVSANSNQSVGVPIEEVVDVINESKIPGKYKSFLILQVDAADINQDGVLDRVDFLDFLARSVPFMMHWQITSSKSSGKDFKDLQVKLQFNKFEKNHTVLSTEENGDDDETDVSIFSTISVATRLSFCSQPWLFIANIIGWTACCFLRPTMAYVAGQMVNVALQMANGDESSRGTLRAGLLGLLLLYVVNEAIFYVVSILTSRVIANTSAHIHGRLVDAVLRTGNKFERKYRPGTLTNAFNSGVAKQEQLLDFLVFDLVNSMASLIAAIVFLALVKGTYAVFVMSFLPLLTSFRVIEDKALESSDMAEIASEKLLSRFQNAQSIRKAAKVCNAEDFVAEKIHTPTLVNAKRTNFLAGYWGNIMFATYSSVAYFIYLLTVILFLISLSNGYINAGEFFSLTSFVFAAIEPIEAVGRFSSLISQMSGAIHQIQKILVDAASDTETVNKEGNSNSSQRSNFEVDLVLDNVWFSYSPQGPSILKGLSVRIPAGSYVAVLGKSGSGKSSFLSLLIGTQRCSSGDIYLDGIPLSTMPLRALRDSLGVVFQETFVFDGTVRDNIAFGCKALTLDDIVSAAKDARIHDFIESLPQKYETIIGKETTVEMSGGQLQRICGIARALARKPKLLILDESSSALDNVTERQFFDTIERLAREKGLTVISVTHRTSTAINADMILVLDQGVIAEAGTYEELTTGDSNRGLFAELLNAGRGSASGVG